VKRHGVVVIENLRVKAMTASARGTAEEPGRNVAAKAGLNRSILDKGWGEMRRQLAYKLSWSGDASLRWTLGILRAPVGAAALSMQHRASTATGSLAGHADTKNMRTPMPPASYANAACLLLISAKNCGRNGRGSPRSPLRKQWQ